MENFNRKMGDRRKIHKKDKERKEELKEGIRIKRRIKQLEENIIKFQN